MVWLYAIGSVVLVSVISFVGALTLVIGERKLHKAIRFMISFAAGALFADAFLHLLPEAVEELGFSIEVSLAIILGIAIMFIVEKFIHWHHCHDEHEDEQPHAFAITSLVGDAVHNFIDGLVIGSSYLAGIPVGIATTAAIIFHEIPQEISDFSVLIHGGFKPTKALLLNFITALTSVAGALVALALGERIMQTVPYLVAFTAGTFVYIAGADFIPELHKETRVSRSILQLVLFATGVGVMASLLLME